MENKNANITENFANSKNKSVLDYNESYCELVKHILLSLFTFGIWMLIWIYRTTKALNKAPNCEKYDPTKKLLLCMFVPFYEIYWFYKHGEKIDKLNAVTGNKTANTTVYLLLAIFIPVVACILMQDNINKLCVANACVETGDIKNQNEIQPTKTTIVRKPIIRDENANSAALLKRAFMFLEDGDWTSANEYCEAVLDIEPENAQAYLGKLLSELRVKNQENLTFEAEPFDHSKNYQKAIRFGDEKLKAALTGYIEDIKTRNENARFESIYTNANDLMSAANTEKQYTDAAILFNSISEYQDSAALAQSCYEKAEVARKDAILSAAKRKMSLHYYKNAISLFESIPGWKDADEQIITCKKKIEEIKAKQEAERLEKERIAKRNKRIAIITTPIVCAIIAFIIVLNAVIIPNNKYNEAIALADEGKYIEAYDAFIALEDYKDSSDKASSIYGKYEIEKMKGAKVGDYVFFGAYEQDNNTYNGKEDIEWLVLDVKDGKALVISKYALDSQDYNKGYEDTTWETCTLRKWLNNDFLNAAFTNEEKEFIPTVTVSATKNPHYKTKAGKSTKDKVFLLSITEANKYFTSDSERQCEPTKYAVANGANNRGNGICYWWLRTPSFDQKAAANVNRYGDVCDSSYLTFGATTGVRPALWIDLNS